MLLMHSDVLDKYVEAYEKGEPLIPDAVYDALSNNDGPLGTEGKVEHEHRMYSLKKYYNEYAAPKLSGKIKSPKLDGVAVSVYYEKGRPVQVLTRGDGIKGNDATTPGFLILARNENHSIPFLEPCWIHGEMAASVPVDNSRNIVAGILNTKNINEAAEKVATYDVQFFAYNIFPNPEDSWFSCMEKLVSVLDAPDTVPTDGFVFRVDSYKDYFDMGFTDKYPRGAFALKEETEQVPTTIKDVVWQLGKSGTITPVAILEPIEIDGATISRATLHNAGFIEDLELCLNDKVLIERRGGTIPQVVAKIT